MRLLKHITSAFQDPYNYMGSAGVVMMFMRDWMMDAYSFVVAERVYLAGGVLFLIAAFKKVIEALKEMEELKQEKIRTRDLEDELKKQDNLKEDDIE